MKKTGILLVFVMFFGFVHKAAAQWTDLEWEAYGIGFKAPSGFTLKQNDSKAFTATGAIFTMSIKPWKDASITDPVAICQRALDLTAGTNKTVIAEEEIDDLGGLIGYEGYCTAVQSGKLMHIVVGGYLDPNSKTNFTVQLLFWDNVKQNKKNLEAALYILSSFKVLDE